MLRVDGLAEGILYAHAPLRDTRPFGISQAAFRRHIPTPNPVFFGFGASAQGNAQTLLQVDADAVLRKKAGYLVRRERGERGEVAIATELEAVGGLSGGADAGCGNAFFI